MNRMDSMWKNALFTDITIECPVHICNGNCRFCEDYSEMKPSNIVNDDHHNPFAQSFGLDHFDNFGQMNHRCRFNKKTTKPIKQKKMNKRCGNNNNNNNHNRNNRNNNNNMNGSNNQRENTSETTDVENENMNSNNSQREKDRENNDNCNDHNNNNNNGNGEESKVNDKNINGNTNNGNNGNNGSNGNSTRMRTKCLTKPSITNNNNNNNNALNMNINNGDDYDEDDIDDEQDDDLDNLTQNGLTENEDSDIDDEHKMNNNSNNSNNNNNHNKNKNCSNSHNNNNNNNNGHIDSHDDEESDNYHENTDNNSTNNMNTNHNNNNNNNHGNNGNNNNKKRSKKKKKNRNNNNNHNNHNNISCLDDGMNINDTFCISAHKSVLSSVSLVFHAMLNSQHKEADENRIVINDLCFNTMYHLLSYAYCNKVENNWQCDLKALFAAAEKYQIYDLCHICLEKMENLIDINTVCDLLVFIQRYKDNHHIDQRMLGKFETNLLEFMVENYPQISKMDCYHKLKAKIESQLTMFMYTKQFGPIKYDKGN